MSMCLYSCLCYPAFKAHVPYYIVICGLSGSNIFFHILINGTIFGKKLLNMKCVFCLKHFSFQEEFSGVLSQMYIGHHVKYPLFLTHFKRNLNFLHRFSKKTSNIKFHENSSSGSRVVPYGQIQYRTDSLTDRHDEVNSRLSQFCKRA